MRTVETGRAHVLDRLRGAADAVDRHTVGVEQGFGKGRDFAFVVDGEAQDSAPSPACTDNAAPALDRLGHASQDRILAVLAIRPDAQYQVFRKVLTGHGEAGGIGAAVGERVKHLDQVSTYGSQAVGLTLLVHYSANAAHSV